MMNKNERYQKYVNKQILKESKEKYPSKRNASLDRDEDHDKHCNNEIIHVIPLQKYKLRKNISQPIIEPPDDMTKLMGRLSIQNQLNDKLTESIHIEKPKSSLYNRHINIKKKTSPYHYSQSSIEVQYSQRNHKASSVKKQQYNPSQTTYSIIHQRSKEVSKESNVNETNMINSNQSELNPQHKIQRDYTYTKAHYMLKKILLKETTSENKKIEVNEQRKPNHGVAPLNYTFLNTPVISASKDKTEEDIKLKSTQNIQRINYHCNVSYENYSDKKRLKESSVDKVSIQRNRKSDSMPKLYKMSFENYSQYNNKKTNISVMSKKVYPNQLPLSYRPQESVASFIFKYPYRNIKYLTNFLKNILFFSNAKHFLQQMNKHQTNNVSPMILYKDIKACQELNIVFRKCLTSNLSTIPLIIKSIVNKYNESIKSKRKVTNSKPSDQNSTSKNSYNENTKEPLKPQSIKEYQPTDDETSNNIIYINDIDLDQEDEDLNEESNDLWRYQNNLTKMKQITQETQQIAYKISELAKQIDIYT